MDEGDRSQVRADFDEVVDMAPAELERWLATDPSHEAGVRLSGRVRRSGLDCWLLRSP